MLDTRTLFVLLAVTTVLMTLMLSFGLHVSSAAGLVKWIVGLAFIAFFWILVLARPVVPYLVGYPIANAAMITGLCVPTAASSN